MNEPRPASSLSKMASISGRSAFLQMLSEEGVEYLFGNPGTTELAIMDALAEHTDLQYVLGLQEALVVAMADGYARASGRLAACNVHVAPGLGNAIGSLFNAKFYGSPVLITAGQHEQGHGSDRAVALRSAAADCAADGEVGRRGRAPAGPAAYRAASRESRADATDRSRVHQSSRRHP